MSFIDEIAFCHAFLKYSCYQCCMLSKMSTEKYEHAFSILPRIILNPDQLDC